ncbi:hypothetical protein M8494_28535 [Serratia ureilytica]
MSGRERLEQDHQDHDGGDRAAVRAERLLRGFDMKVLESFSLGVLASRTLVHNTLSGK